MSLLVICKFLEVFANTFTFNDKYPLRNCEKFKLTIQRHLSKKQKAFSENFIPFHEFASNFKHFGKNNYRHN